MNRKGQEEMMGFALIVILIAVIVLIFLGLSLGRHKSQNVESYEAQSFLQSMLQYTTTCQNNFGYMSVKDLIFACDESPSTGGSVCSNGKYSCQVLNETLKNIMSRSWPVSQGSAIKGYALNVTSKEGTFIVIEKGNYTLSSQGTSQTYSESGNSVGILLRVYS